MTTTTPSGQLQNDIFQGNLIGTDKTGKVALGNTLHGIEIQQGTGITIGGTGPGQGNVIANSGYYGVYLEAGEQIQITRNSIFGNAKQGIYVGYLQNGLIGPPTLTFTPASASTGTLSGTIASAKKNASYVFEVFSDPTSTYGTGQTFVKAIPITTDGNGNGSFSITVPNGYYSATTTDALGDTSEFSTIAGVVGLPVTVTTVTSSANPSTLGQQVTFTALVTVPGYQGTPTGTVTFTIDGRAQSPVPLTAVGSNVEAQFVTSTLTAGPHTVTASYSGDANVSPSSGSLSTQTVTAPGLKSTTTTLTSSLNPSTYGQMVTFTAVVSPGASAGSPTGTVSFTIDGAPLTPVALQKVGGVEEAVFSTAALSAGTHTVSATYNGDATFSPSVVSSDLAQTVNAGSQGGDDGPTVASLQRFGIHMQPTTLVLTFNDGLDPTSASNLANYKIVGPDGRTVAISSATFDAALNTVTLRPKTRINLHHTYELTVVGTGARGVRDTHGTLLDGANNGQPGSNYTGSLTWRNVVWTPAEYQKYVHPQHAKPAGALKHHFPSRKI
jgi:hypothetical protein